MNVDDYINQILINSGQSQRDSVLTDVFSGIDINNYGAAVNPNLENVGYTFFSKPDMNLSYDNLKVDRKLSMLLSENPDSLARQVRCLLDPMSQRAGKDAITASAVDEASPWITVLGNSILSISGFEDITIGTHTSEPGRYREQWSYYDDVPYNYGAYTLQCRFRPLPGDPISLLLFVWSRYGSLAYEGRLLPYPENIITNTMDYTTRIYRLVMDPTKTYITRMFATGYSFPVSVGLSQHADMDISGNASPFGTSNQEITFNFQSVGFDYYDYMLAVEFNDLTEAFNPSMGGSKSGMRKLLPAERNLFNRKSYPWINIKTMELEWWVTNAMYQSRINAIV